VVLEKSHSSLFRKAGQRLYTPTLTGLGEKAHLLTPEVGLSTHIQDIVQLIEENELSDVILLGHSYSGMVITGVVDRIPERIGHLVYLDAVVPRDGESMADFAPMVINAFLKDARAHGDGWRVNPPREMPFGIGGLYGVTQEPDLSWVRSMVSPQSLKTFEEPLHLKDPAIVSKKPRTFIRCNGSGFAMVFRDMMRHLLARRTLAPSDPGWRLRQLPTGHDCMITMPKELTDLLLEIANL
jgi:pimeloyl-ACP methyl ester carboxylesterase